MVWGKFAMRPCFGVDPGYNSSVFVVIERFILPVYPSMWIVVDVIRPVSKRSVCASKLTSGKGASGGYDDAA